MSIVRFTYKNALHHVYNRGINKMPVFLDDGMKYLFINLLREQSRKHGIRLFSYCIMSNHYHITLMNNTQRMSDMMRNINSIFAIAYNAKNNRKGYVWENRFGSVPIEDTKHLITVIAYNLMNPVRAGIVNNFCMYKWSSVHELFAEKSNKSGFLTDYNFVEELFGNIDNMQQCMKELGYKRPQYSMERYLTVIGSENYLHHVIKVMNRRNPVLSTENRMKRIKDKPIQKQSIEEIIDSFEKQFMVHINDLDYRISINKKIRLLLLLSIRENTASTYEEIHNLKPFGQLKFSSLSALYSYACKLRKQGKI